MKKKLLLLISALILAISVFALSSCKNDSDGTSSGDTELKVTYSLEGTLPNAVFGEELDLSPLSIKITEGSSVTSIPVTSNMIISGGTYGTGMQSIVLAYNGTQFTTTVLVQYRVTFMDGDEVLKVQYVTSADEIEPPTVESEEGMKFSGWEPDVNAPLSDNVTYKAVYNHVIPTPESVYNATYGDTLSAISLPSTVLGHWEFDLPETAKVGNAGSNTFLINFVILGGEVIATDTVTVEVEKKELTFKNVVTEFTYNGQRQIPTYDFDGVEIAKENVFFISDGRSNYTDAGTYTYEFVINDANYSGSATGTYTINKAAVTVKVGNSVMSIIDTIPEISYTVEGFGFLPESELGLSLLLPEKLSAGTTYEIGAAVTNQNVILTVVPGTLSVTNAIPNVNDVRYPVFIIGDITYDANNTPSKFVLPAIYGDKFEDFAFESNPNGTWSFGEKTGLLGDASDDPYLYEVVFVHNDERYDPLVIEIPVKVNKKQLKFEVSGTTVVYNGEEQGFTYNVLDANGNVYTGLNVVNYKKYTDVKMVNGEVGKYEITISLDEKNYEAQQTVYFKINQAVPVTDFTTVYEAYWSDTLSDINLPTGYSWNNPLTVLDRVNETGNSFSATYTPADTNNYATVEGSFTVKTLHAPTYITVDERFETTYNGLEYIFNVSANRDKDKIKKVYYYLGTNTPVDPDKIANAGEYKVVFSLEQNEYYASASAECVLVINQATNTDRINTAQSAVYRDLVKDKLTLPGSNWKWYLNGIELGSDATVGTAGTHIYVAKYTDPDGNYAEREVDVTVTVAKLVINTPTAPNTSSVFDGSTIYSGLTSTADYTVLDNGGKNAGTYFAHLTLTDSLNFAWDNSKNESTTVSVSYVITKATNEFTTTFPDSTVVWTYLDTPYTFSASAKFGGNAKVTYYTDKGVYISDTVPTDAGSYVARYTVQGEGGNYDTITHEVSFIIEKLGLTVPGTKDNVNSFTYTGNEITFEIDGSVDATLYMVIGNKGTDAKSYQVQLTLTDEAKKNYYWNNTDGDTAKIGFTITPATIVIESLTLSGWTYGAEAGVPNAKYNLSDKAGISYTYYVINDDGTRAKLSAKPTDAGNYVIIATVDTAANYVGDSKELLFSITKADASISADLSYTFTYNGQRVTLSGIKGSHGEADVVLILENEQFSATAGVYTTNAINAGTYTFNALLRETKNYNEASLLITVIINRAENTDTVTLAQSAVYGDLVKDKLTLPGADWKWYLNGIELSADATVGTAGTHTYVAKYTDPNGNYADREAEITVTVAKQEIKLPIISNHKYDGNKYVPAVSGENFTVIENEGGTNTGEYTVTLKLNDKANFKWATTDEETVTITYKISEAVNNWKEIPTASNSVFGETLNVSAKAEFGGVKIEYAPFGTDSYSETAPTNAGKYSVRFTTTDTNYETLTESLTFSIFPKEIVLPTFDLSTFVYNGGVQKPTIALNNEAYTIVYSNENSKNTGTYTVTFTLNASGNYAWVGGANDVITLTYTITKANARLEVSIDGWTFSEDNSTKKNPTYTAVFEINGVYFLYAEKNSDNYSATVPETAGTYKVKAVYDGDENVAYSESLPKEFTIAKASAIISGYNSSYTTEYNTDGFSPAGIYGSNAYGELSYKYYDKESGTLVSTDAKIYNAGVYTLVVSFSGSANYEEAEDVEITVTITAKVNTDTLETVTATYGQSLGEIAIITALPNANGTWQWKNPTDKVGNANALGHKYVAVFIPANDNYADREAEITVIVEKQVIYTPEIPDANKAQPYTGNPISSGIAKNDSLYTVYGDNRTVKGTHTLTLTLTEQAKLNYAWNDKNNTEVSVFVTYDITTASNSWTEAPSLSVNTWVYGEASATVSAAAKFGTVNIYYLKNGNEMTNVMPTTVGNHKVVLSVAENDNYYGLDEVTLTFVITPKKIDAPTAPSAASSTFTYNKFVQKPALTENSTYYTVTYSNSNSTDVGTYTITVALKETSNHSWADGTTEDIVYTYTIGKANSSITGFVANGWTGWTYKQYEASPIPSGATTNFGTIVYTFHDKDGNPLSARPEDVGEYSVKATVTGTDNYNGDTETLTFTISKAKVTLSGYSQNQFSGIVFQNDLDLSIKSDFKAEYIYTGVGGNTVKEAVSGTFAYTKVVFAGADSYVSLTFTPASSNYYADPVKFDLSLKSVAILKTADGSVEYGTIENALSDAVSGDEVWAIPCTDDSGNVETVVIKSDVIVKAGVTLIISWGIDDSSRNLFADDGFIYATVTDDGDADTQNNKINGLSELKKLASVKLEAGKTITNHGTIEISGELGAPGGGVNYTGHTARNYAELVLGAGAQIISKTNSSIVCCGFIYEESLNNGSSVTIESGAVIYEPFVLRDWRGGTYTSFIYSNVTGGKAVVFNMFEIINVTSRLTIFSGGEVKALANIFAGDQMNAATPTIIGTVTDAIIQLNTDKSYVTAKYNPETHKCDLDIYGGAQTNGMLFRVDTGTLGVKEIDSSVTYFPISYFFDISLNDNGNNSVYYMNQAFKILTGGKLTVGENVTLIAKKIILYEEFTDECVIPGKYPAGLPAGELNLYGTLIIESLGGIVTAKSNDARIIVSSALSALTYESTTYSTLLGYNVGMNHKEMKFTAKLKSMNGEIIDISAGGYGLGTYYVENGIWTILSVSFNSNGGSSASAIHINGESYPSLPTVTKEGYTFLGWYYNGQLIQSGDALVMSKSHELVAEWKPLIPVRLDENGDGTAESTLYVDPDNAVYPALPTLTMTGSEFLGWYFGNDKIESGMALKSGDAHTLTALWQTYYKVTFDSTSDVFYVDPDNAVYPTLPTPVKEGSEFLGWYYGETKVEGGSLAINADHELVARWQRYYSITLDSVSDVLYVDPDNAVYPTLPTPVKEGSEFLGWYFEGVLVESGAALLVEGDHELVAAWKVLVPITLDPNGGTVSDNAVYFDSEGGLTYPALPTPTREGYKFLGWKHVDTNEIAEEGKALLVVGEHSLVAEWELLSYTLTLGTMSNASVTVSVNGEEVSSGASIPYGSIVSIIVTYNKSDSKTLTVKNDTANSNVYSGSATSYEFTMPAGNVTITASSKDPSCVTPDTLVTLADGTQIRVDELTGKEELLVWNHETGKLEKAPIAYIVNHNGLTSEREVIYLTFENGNTVKIVGEHVFFDVTLNKYVAITDSDAKSFIGHEFASLFADGNSVEASKLISVHTETVVTAVYEVVTYKHLTCFTEGILSSSAYLDPLLNIFDINEETLAYDIENVAKDIETYGLYTYADFESLISEEAFELYNAKYLKIAVGKGYITWNDILDLIDIYFNAEVNPISE